MRRGGVELISKTKAKAEAKAETNKTKPSKLPKLMAHKAHNLNPVSNLKIRRSLINPSTYQPINL